ncbi:methyltransferase domain-containing protein [archaeon]|nr:methyltransferase domain-containing protein [archaeon]
MLDIGQYLDEESIVFNRWNDFISRLDSSLNDQDRSKFQEALTNYQNTPWNFEYNQRWYDVLSQLEIDGVPLISYIWGLDRDQIEKTVPFILNHIQGSGLVLDVGAGTGHKTNFYGLKLEGKIIGLDVNEIMLKIANKKRRTNNVSYLRGSVFNLPFENDLFDSAIYTNSIQEDGFWSGGVYSLYGSYDERQSEKIKELARVVRPNGMLIIGHNGFDGFDEAVIQTMKDNRIKIKEHMSFNYSGYINDSTNHVTVGIKQD